MSETCRGHLLDKIVIKLFASSWYIFLTYIYDARSHLYLYPKLNGHGDNGQRKVWTQLHKTVIKCHANTLTVLYRHNTVSHIQCSTATHVKCTDTTAQHLSKPPKTTQLPKLFTRYNSTSTTKDNAGQLKHAALGGYGN